MAQLVARFPCKEEVSGSIPDVSIGGLFYVVFDGFSFILFCSQVLFDSEVTSSNFSIRKKMLLAHL